MAVLSYIKGLFQTTPGTDDPKNWPRREKNIVVLTIAYCAFVAPLGSSIYMPALLQVKEDLNTTSSMISATYGRFSPKAVSPSSSLVSVYVLFMGIMPVFWASLCDYYGRRPIYLVSMSIYILGSVLAAISRNIWVFLVMRALQAFGASSVLSVGGGSLSDIFHSGERGAAFGLFYLGPLVAPMIGPIIGGVLSDRAGWRSTMWLLLGSAVVAFLLVLFILPETYRHHIDEATTKEDDDSSKTVGRQLHANHSDPTLVASKSSLHGDNASVRSPRFTKDDPSLSLSPVAAAASASSDRLSVHSRLSRRSSAAGESAMEFIVPNYVPPDLLAEEEERMEGGSTSIPDAKDEMSGTDSGSSAVERHVAFSASESEKQHQATKEQDLENAPGSSEAPKRKPFNPLRPLICLRQPTNALLVGFNALALGAQYCMNNTLSISFHDNYHLSESTIGFCFCAGGFGSVVGSVLGGRYSDYVMRQWLIKQELKRRRDQKDREAAFSGSAVAALSEEDEVVVVDVSVRAPPEVRLRSHLPIAYALVGIFFTGFGMMMVFSSTTTALVDANSDNNMSTSAVACNSFARGVTGAISGLASLPMQDSMGDGWLYTFWAMMTLVGAAGLILMVVKAKTWRQKAADKALDRV
ncbi:hypothetical protein BGZ75_004580 [Mortierella antarctica]|nr:hypothetical protein BGZ75_004580 [Mortierella antarctica]